MPRPPGSFALLLVLACGCHRAASARARATAAADAGATADVPCVPTETIAVRRPALSGTRRDAYTLARALASTQGPELAASLRPDSEDYAAVFDPPLARSLEEWAARYWDALDQTHGVMLNEIQLARAPNEGPREVELFALTPDLLARPGSELCGRAYVTSGIERHLAAGTTIYCYSFHEVDHVAPPPADALVYVRGHWAFFPHPNAAPKSSYAPKCPPRVTTASAPIAILTPTPSSDPAGPDAARETLERMLGDRDHAHDELTKLEPTLADVRAVYREPAASRLFAAMKPKWQAVRRGGDYEDATSHGVLPSADDEIVHLAASPPDRIGGVDSGCPVGYRQVAADLLPTARIYCFTFSHIGLNGIGGDGLVFVRGRWVLIPRPWELLKK